VSIEGYSREKFKDRMNEYLSASGPVRSHQHLQGREKEMALIDEALAADGRHVFIYGDRGVGKTSLAQSAANLYPSSGESFIHIGCGKDTKFYGAIEDLADQVIKKVAGEPIYNVTQAVNLKLYSIKWGKEEKEISIPIVTSMYTAVEAIEVVCRYCSEIPVIVIDEFDRIDSENERELFASFLKHLGDRGVNVKLIFTGVAQSVMELLGNHESSFRQLHTILLERLNWTGREDIVKEAVRSFGLDLNTEVAYKIAKISNGFPFFVHLITEKILWCAFESVEVIRCIDFELFDDAIEKAINSISAHLYGPYNAASMHRTHDYKEILWATADSENTIRYIDGMYSSYLRINTELYGSNPSENNRPLPRTKFTARLSNFKKKSFGSILESVADRKGIYTYRENILRGFVAMKALESGIELRGDIPDEPKKPTALGKETRSGYAGKKNFTAHIKFRGEK